VRLPLDVEAALAFAARHPAGHFDDRLRRRLVTQLSSAPAGTIVLGEGPGEIRLVATVVDVIADPAAPAEVVVVGASSNVPAEVFAAEVLAPARAYARAVGRRAVEAPRPACVVDAEDAFARAGFAFAYETVVMRRPGAQVDAPEPELPRGWRWAPLEDALVSRAHAALDEIFRAAPSFTLPPLDVFRAGAFQWTPGWHLLFDEDALAGLVRVAAKGAQGELQVVGRAPAYRGHGVGRRLVARGLRLLAGAGAGAVTLEAAARNDRALALYRAFDFEIVERTPVFSAAL
jgi:ribosomal protein S18 acetylase RimI-like enzyme